MTETYSTRTRDLAIENFLKNRSSEIDVELDNHILAQKDIKIVVSDL